MKSSCISSIIAIGPATSSRSCRGSMNTCAAPRRRAQRSRERCRAWSRLRHFARLRCLLKARPTAPHFDRIAFKVARIYATLAPDGRTANLKFAPDEQELKCMVAADAFAPVPNAWGKQGWTTATLAKLTEPELKSALEMAWQHAQREEQSAKRERLQRQVAVTLDFSLQFQIPCFGVQLLPKSSWVHSRVSLKPVGDINLARAFEDAMGP